MYALCPMCSMMLCEIIFLQINILHRQTSSDLVVPPTPFPRNNLLTLSLSGFHTLPPYFICATGICNRVLSSVFGIVIG